MTDQMSEGPPAIKDEQGEHPIAGAWHRPLRQVVQAFIRGDYGLTQGIAGVERIPAADAEHIRAYIANYGATLLELPDEAWDTSVAQWQGTHWDILVDLWTAEEGRSDLVLSCCVHETEAGYRITPELVYVP